MVEVKIMFRDQENRMKWTEKEESDEGLEV